MKKITLLLALCFSLSLLAEDKNGIIYVKPNATGTGSSWSDALGSIQAAIDKAREVNDARKDVWVAGGEYIITTAILLNDSINVYGSFAGTETSVAERAKPENAKAWEFVNATTLKGSGARLVESRANFDIETIFDGFILTDGNGVGTQLNNNGGAAVVRNKTTIQNCIIRNSTASNGSAGGVNMTGGTVRNSWIVGNKQSVNTNGGGGFYINTVSGNVTIVENCVIERNESTIRGGAINVQGVGMSHLRNLHIINNMAFDSGSGFKQGGAIYCNSGNNVISNSVIANNSGTNAYYMRGKSLNNTIVNNVGGVYLSDNQAPMQFINNIVWGNLTEPGGTNAVSVSGIASAGTIATNNATYFPLPTSNNWTLANNVLFPSNVTNGDFENPAEGKLASGPHFVKVSPFRGVASADEEIAELALTDWRIKYNSPLLNIGTTLTETATDMRNITRPQGDPENVVAYDLGAYELPYFNVFAGEAPTANGKIYNMLGMIADAGDFQTLPYGMKTTYVFEPNTGFSIDKAYYKTSSDNGVTFDGEAVDFTSEIATTGEWESHAISQSFKVFVEWRNLTALNNINYKVHIFTEGALLRIEGLNITDNVSIYSINGVKVFTANASDVYELELEKGFYIVRVNDEARKITIK